MNAILRISTYVVLLFAIVIYYSCKKDLECKDCIPNKSPIAVAGPDQVIILPTDSVSLDGSSSSDPDGTISSYLWQKISGPASFKIDNSGAVKGKIRNLVAGIYEFELKVTDNVGLWVMDTVQVLVDDTSVNQPPVANAGPDREISLPLNMVILNGAASIDPENKLTAFEWTKISGPSAINFVSSNSIVTEATGFVKGDYNFELKVTDDGGLFSRDTIKITIITGNILPIARAGNDTVIQSGEEPCFITSFVVPLNDIGSSDPDGTIANYLWFGPGVITNADKPHATVRGLQSVVNRFFLKVTDNHGGYSFDTMYVTIQPASRQIVTAQLTSIGQLSEARSGLAIAAAGNKLIFAGGWPQANNLPASSRVDIYDISTGAWTTHQLAQGRISIGTATHGNKIFLAGGGVLVANIAGGYEYTSNSSSARIDIYDASSNTWTTSQLSTPRSPTGASAGNKVVFAGGDDFSPSSRVDIYDVMSGIWSYASLSESKHISQAAVSDNKIYFGGGSTDFFFGGSIFENIDIYDASSNTWQLESLNEPRGHMGVIAANGKIYWGGGFVNNGAFDAANSVEVRDVGSNTTSLICLAEARGFTTAVRKDNKIIFYVSSFGGNKFDIFDLTTNTWSVGVLPENVVSAGRILSYNNVLYVTEVYIDGKFSKDVYRLSF